MKIGASFFAPILIAANFLAAMAGAPAFAQQPGYPSPAREQGAQRDFGVYLGLGYEGLAIKFESVSTGPGFSAIQARGGVILNRYLALEAQASLAIDSYEFDENGVVYEANDFSLGSNYGVFVAPRLPLNNAVALTGRFGWVEHDIEFDAGGTIRGSGPAYGLGLGFDLDSLTLGADLTLMDLEYEDGPFTEPATGISFAVSAVNRF